MKQTKPIIIYCSCAGVAVTTQLTYCTKRTVYKTIENVKQWLLSMSNAFIMSCDII